MLKTESEQLLKWG